MTGKIKAATIVTAFWFAVMVLGLVFVVNGTSTLFAFAAAFAIVFTLVTLVSVTLLAYYELKYWLS